LLKAWSDGDRDALERLTPLVVEELKRIARRHVNRERGEHTLQAGALVDEAYLRLVDAANVRWQDRAHFFAISARIMRRILLFPGSNSTGNPLASLLLGFPKSFGEMFTRAGSA
jgi:hypothetical protein